MENWTLKDFADLSMNAVLLVMLWQLWQRLTVLTDRIFEYLQDAKQDREEMKASLAAKEPQN